jgi:hypothetical protein
MQKIYIVWLHLLVTSALDWREAPAALTSGKDPRYLLL